MTGSKIWSDRLYATIYVCKIYDRINKFKSYTLQIIHNLLNYCTNHLKCEELEIWSISEIKVVLCVYRPQHPLNTRCNFNMTSGQVSGGPWRCMVNVDPWSCTNVLFSVRRDFREISSESRLSQKCTYWVFIIIPRCIKILKHQILYWSHTIYNYLLLIGK